MKESIFIYSHMSFVYVYQIKKINGKKNMGYHIMNLMIPSTRHKDNFILFLGAFQPDSLHILHEMQTCECKYRE